MVRGGVRATGTPTPHISRRLGNEIAQLARPRPGVQLFPVFREAEEKIRRQLPQLPLLIVNRLAA